MSPPSPVAEAFRGHEGTVDEFFTNDPNTLGGFAAIGADKCLSVPLVTEDFVDELWKRIADGLPTVFVIFSDVTHAALLEAVRAAVAGSEAHGSSLLAITVLNADCGGAANYTEFDDPKLFVQPIRISISHSGGYLGPGFQIPIFEPRVALYSPAPTCCLLHNWSFLGAVPPRLIAHDHECSVTAGPDLIRPLLVDERQAIRGYRAATEYLIDEIVKHKKDIDEVNAVRHKVIAAALPVFPFSAVIDAFHPRSALENAKAGAATKASLFDFVPTEVVAGAEAVRLACPYLLDRSSRDLSTDEFLPPGHEDLWAHNDTASTGWQQSRESIREATRHISLLPSGIPPKLHALCASACPSPYSDPMGIADDLDFATRTTMSLGAAAGHWRKTMMQTLREAAKGLDDMKPIFDRHRSGTSPLVSSHISIERFLLMVHIVNWPDRTLPELIQQGAHISGRLPHSGIYRKGLVTPTVPRDELFETSVEWIDYVCSRPPPLKEQRDAIWLKSAAEIESGVLRGWWTRKQMDSRWGRRKWRPLIRFATWQAGAGKWRLIDNGRSASHNWSLEADERIHTTSVRAGAAIARRMRKIAGRRLSGGLQPTGATQDMTRAFRQLGVREADRGLHIVTVWSEEEGAWVFGELDGLAFGLGAAVLEFNRVPALICAVARRWLGIPVVNFYDDFRISDILASGGDANRAFLELAEWLGPWLDQGKEQPPAQAITFLGTLEDASQVAAVDTIFLRALEKRRISLLVALRMAIEERKLSRPKRRRWWASSFTSPTPYRAASAKPRLQVYPGTPGVRAMFSTSWRTTPLSFTNSYSEPPLRTRYRSIQGSFLRRR